MADLPAASWGPHGNYSPGELLRAGKNLLKMGETGTRYGAGLEITGWESLRANLRVIAERYPAELGQVLKEEAMAVMEESVQECPVDDKNYHTDMTPHLVDTADVIGPEIEDGDITVWMTYATPYAVIQHENLDFHHTRAGTKAKYLEDPLMRRAPFIATNLVKGVDLERMNTGYFATGTATLIESRAQQNPQRQAINKYGHMLGRFV